MALASTALAQLGQGTGAGSGEAGVVPAPAGNGLQHGPATYQLFYDLKMKLRSGTIDTDLWAGAKLQMRGQRRSDGTLGLGLVRAIEDPWKFFWFTAGLLGSGVYASAEIAPGTPAYAVRTRAETRAWDFLRGRHAAWKREWRGKAEFSKDHQPFCFYVVGDPGWRFKASARPTGRLDGVENLMTHAWIPDGLRKWEQGSQEIGYTFWGNDPQPPDWEPRTYQGLTQALALLDAPGFAPEGLAATMAKGQGGSYAVDQRAIPQAMVRIVETLLPRAKGKMKGSADARLEYRVTGLDATRLSVEGAARGIRVADGNGMALSVTRSLVYDRTQAMMESDVLTAHLAAGGDKDLTVTVGYRPEAGR